MSGFHKYWIMEVKIFYKGQSMLVVKQHEKRQNTKQIQCLLQGSFQ